MIKTKYLITILVVFTIAVACTTPVSAGTNIYFAHKNNIYGTFYNNNYGETD